MPDPFPAPAGLTQVVSFGGAYDRPRAPASLRITGPAPALVSDTSQPVNLTTTVEEVSDTYRAVRLERSGMPT